MNNLFLIKSLSSRRESEYKFRMKEIKLVDDKKRDREIKRKKKELKKKVII